MKTWKGIFCIVSNSLLVCQFNRYQLPKNLTGCKEKRIRYFGHAEIFLWIRAIFFFRIMKLSWIWSFGFFDGCLDDRCGNYKKQAVFIICITNNTRKVEDATKTWSFIWTKVSARLPQCGHNFHEVTFLYLFSL